MRRTLVVLAATVTLASVPQVLSAQQSPVERQRAAAERLIGAALRDSAAYRRLGELVDRFGNRPSGSARLEQAIDWIVEQMQHDGLENVHTEPAMVTHWERGTESAVLVSPRAAPLHMLGLGRSVGTPDSGITAPVLVVRDFAELRARAADARGKIVVYNHPFDTTAYPFDAYEQAVRYRGAGADSGAAVGAVAVLVRSVASRSLQSPHTGGMSYGDSTRRIPAAAITIEDAEMLARMQARGEHPVVRLTMGARMLPLAPSRNVIAELRGSEHPEEVIVIGGHIDSWDVGQGAMDDGGGAVAAWEALRLIKASGVRPRRTIRVVLWTNEELGLGGGRAYAAAHASEIEHHVLAMESDNGAFRPRGIFFAGTDSGLAAMRPVAALLSSMDAASVKAGGLEADVSPLAAAGVPAASIEVDPSRYFWYHHTEADMLDKLDPHEVGMCVAVMAVVANTVANMDGTIPRSTAGAVRRNH